ncbi:MAG: outer membrane beta-barrel protein [Bacteroidetes bacterium]|nr:outer membrane beta-barrel protein [Bacteroidota bacterium]
MRHLLSLLLLAFITNISLAQSVNIKGSIADTLNNNQLPNGCITVMRAKDSVMVAFTRTKEDGSFSLNVKPNQKYLIMATYPGLADYLDIINIKEDKVDLGIIPMVSKTHLLKDFVLTKQYAAIKVKGDTIEYIADSFKVRDNATVEALLKRLPGIQVDKNGQIVAQGEQVKKVLVDGEEFFTDDPAVVTKSLQAKAVDKVQVYDKKSDQAEFTGIDDGEKTKTINLQLKEDKKKGYFGKVIAGGGAGDERGYYENQAMFNAFKGKRQFSLFGIMANTGKVGLGWEDRDKYGGNDGSNSFMDEDGGFVTYYTSDGDDDFESWDGKYNGQGLPRALTGGAHFADKWNKEQQHLSSNYRYGKQEITTTSNNLTEYTLPDSQYFSKQTKNVYKMGQRHRVDGLFEWKFDSTATVKLTANAGYSTANNTTDIDAQTLTEDGQIVNSSKRRTTNDGVTKSINSTLDWRRKFKKKGRTISLNVSENYRENEGNGFLNNTSVLNSKDSAGNIKSATIVFDQKKIASTESLNLSSRLSYTEPLSKVAFLELNYSAKVNNNTAIHETYDKRNPLGDTYDSLNTFYSNKYRYNIFTNQGGTNLRFVFKKINFSAGVSVSNADFKQTDLMLDTTRTYNFTNFFPSANFTYKLSKQSRFSIGYHGNTTQPTIDQIQPLRNNTDPLNIAIGNAGLVQSFTHNFNVSFNDYQMLTGRYLWASANFNFTNNAISRSDNTNAYGARTYQYINVDGNYNGWGYLGYGAKIKKLDLNVGGYAQLGINHVNNVINGINNTSNNNTYTLGLRFDYNTNENKFEVSYNPHVTYNDNKSTISTQTTSYWTQNHEFDISYQLPLKFEIGSDFNWYIRQQTTTFNQNNNVFLWNAYIAKKFLKNDVLELRLTGYDILNQNLGFQRYAYNNYVTQDSYNTIRRYGMLTLTWNFTKTAAGIPQNNAAEMIQIIK